MKRRKRSKTRKSEELWTVYHPGTGDYLKRVTWTKSGLTDNVQWTKDPRLADFYPRKDAISLARNYGPTYDNDPVEIRRLGDGYAVIKKHRVRTREEYRAKKKRKRVIKVRLKRRANIRAKLDRLQAENDKLRRTAIACLKRESGQ